MVLLQLTKLKLLFLLFILTLICMKEIGAKAPFFTTIDTSLLSSLELEKLNEFVDSTAITKKYIVEIEDFRNYLFGSELTINIPNSSDSLVFTTLSTVQDLDGGVYWMGVSSDGSYFRIGEYSEGTMIDMYIENQGSKYLCISITGNRFLLVEYEDWIEVENSYQCINSEETPDDDEEEDDETVLRSRCDNNNIRVLVLVTPLANSLPFNTQVVARNLINELNTTSVASGLSAGEIRYTLANTLILPGFVESTDADDDVAALRNNTVAQGLRDANLADIVILLTGPVYGTVAGVAHKIKARQQNAYCLATINATIGAFTGSHEIGHIIGCRHQRFTVCLSNGDSWPVNAHGFNIGTGFRTIMHSFGCNRVRLGIWSNRTTTLMGTSNGNLINDNAGRMRNRAHKVACFRKGTPSPAVTPNRFIHYIEGQNVICKTQFPPDYTVLFDSNQFPNPQFLWEISENGVTGWHVPLGLVNNGVSCTLPFPASLPERFFLRVTITGSKQNSENDMIQIEVFDDPTGNCEITLRSNNLIEDENTPPITLKDFKIYPNPSYGLFYVTGVAEATSYSVIRMNGSLVESGTFFSTNSNEIELDFSALTPGAYIIKFYDDNNKNKAILQQKIIVK